MEKFNPEEAIKPRKGNSGMAMMIVFIIILIMIPIGLTLIYLLQPEAVFTMKQKKTIEAVSIAEAGANDSLSKLMITFQRVVPKQISKPSKYLSTHTLSIYASSNVDALDFLNDYSSFTKVGTEAILYTTGSIAGGVYYSTITITSNPNPFGDWSVGNPLWDNISKSAILYYNYKIQSTGEIGDHKTTILLDSRDIADSRKNIRATGSFEVGVTKSFARFACFTGNMFDLRGGRTWLYGDYNPSYTGVEYYGPVHTNGQLNIAVTPKFHNYVSSVSSYVWFFNGGAPNERELLADENNDAMTIVLDIPDFGTNPLGLNPPPQIFREADYIKLPDSASDIDDLRDYAWDTDQTAPYPGGSL